MKRLSRSLLVLGFVALATSTCARRETAPPPTAPLALHLTGDPATLDPTTVTEEEELRVVNMMFRPLVGIDDKLATVPALADSWTVSPDGLVYEFHIDPDATWEDGSPVSSDDVRFTLERVRDPRVQATSWRGGLDSLAAIETPERRVVRVRFAQPYSERILAFNMPIVSAAAYEKKEDSTAIGRHPVGTGPYHFVSWEPNQAIRLKRRRDAAGPGFPEIVFRIIPDDATRFRAGSQGELDEFRVGRDQRAGAEADPDFQARNRILRVPQAVEVLVLWNVRNPFLADPRVRIALAHSWSRGEAAKQLYPPEGAELVSGPFPAGVAANASDVAPAAFDAALAARLLDEAGWKPGPDGVRRRGGRKASFDLLVKAGRRMDGNLAEVLRAAWAKVGVAGRISSLDPAVATERAQVGEFDAYLTARIYLPPNFDPFPYYHSTQGAPRGQNMGFYSNARADRAMEEARRENEPRKRVELYREIHRLMAADPPADFLWGAAQYWAINRRVDGVVTSPIGLFDFLPGPLGWRPAPAAAK